MLPNARPLGLITGARAQIAERAIGKAEDLVTVLRSTSVNLKPADEALRLARELYRAQDYADAVAHAKRAKAVAVTLDGRFSAYLAAWEVLDERINELMALGIHTERFEAVNGAAEEKVVAGIQEDGMVIPNYVEATEMLQRASDEARDLHTQASRASDSIFAATLAVESLSEFQSDPTSGWGTANFDLLIEQATADLALGDVNTAVRIATEVKARAQQARDDAARATELLDQTETMLEELRSEGVVTLGLEQKVEEAKSALTKGVVSPAIVLAMARRLSAEGATRRRAHAKAIAIVTEAERVYRRLQAEGFLSYEADATLQEARHALVEGRYSEVRENVQRALKAFVRRRNDRRAIATGIAVTRSKLAALKDRAVPLLPDIHELVERAEQEFRTGSLAGSSEDLLIANVLLSQSVQAGS